MGEKDALKRASGPYLYEHDYIPRRTTVSSLVLEGVAPGGKADSGVLWCAVGYTPCSYAIPVWVAAGERIPSVLTGEAPANQFAVQLKMRLRPAHLRGMTNMWMSTFYVRPSAGSRRRRRPSSRPAAA